MTKAVLFLDSDFIIDAFGRASGDADRLLRVLDALYEKYDLRITDEVYNETVTLDTDPNTGQRYIKDVTVENWINEKEISQIATDVPMLALTFVRTGELIGAKWEEIDWNRGEWHIPKERMKMKRPHVVPLSRQAIAALKGIHTLTGERDFIFFSASAKSKHISNGAVLMALRRMGYKGKMTGHGFRALASTILNEQGYAPDVIERQLAHEDGDKIRSAYNRAEYLLERKKMMQEWADHLDAVQTRNSVIEGKFVKALNAG